MRRSLPLALLVVLVLAIAATALAALPQQNGEVNLADGGDLRLDGSGATNALAGPLAGAGDVNGDGQSDLAVVTETGGNSVVDVHFGPSGKLAATGGPANGLRLSAPGKNLTSVARAGDVNGDRLADVVVGARLGDGPGRAYVVFGRTAPGTIELTGESFGGFALTTDEAGAEFGAAVAGAGDTNGDRLDDVVIGAPGFSGGRGAAFVVFGKGTGTPVSTSSLGAQGVKIAGDSQQVAQLGRFVAGVGDVNGDQRADVGVGAPFWSLNFADQPNDRQGIVFVVHGRAVSGETTVAVANFPGGPVGSDATGYRIEGPGVGAQLAPVAGAGDLNADGRADVVAGAPFDARSGAATGSASVVFGKTDASAVALAALGDKGITFTGSLVDEQFGRDVRGGFDVNGDGTTDVIVGAPGFDVGALDQAGAAYVFFGRSGAGIVSTNPLPSGAGIRIKGTRGAKTGGNAQSGSRIGDVAQFGFGDVNGDGRTDVLVGGAQAALEGGSAFDRGHAWTVLGFGAPDFQYAGTLSGTRGVAYPGAGPSAVRRTGLTTFKIAPPLPAGLAIAEATGRITGTPGAAGTSNHTITMTDQAGAVTRPVKIVIAPGKDVDPPVLSKAKLSRTKFRVGRRATALSSAKRKKRAGIGTVLRFTASEAVTARISILCAGRLSKARRKPCAKLKTKGTFRRTLAVGGESVFTFSGRVGRTPLKPGKYTLTLRATDGVELPSNAIVLRFTVVK